MGTLEVTSAAVGILVAAHGIGKSEGARALFEMGFRMIGAGKYVDSFYSTISRNRIARQVDTGIGNRIRSAIEDENIDAIREIGPLLESVYSTISELRQASQANVILRAIPKIDHDAKVGEDRKEWLAFFLSRIPPILDDQAKELWARLLAGEVNRPSTFSKRAITFLETASAQDADDMEAVARSTLEHVLSAEDQSEPTLWLRSEDLGSDPRHVITLAGLLRLEGAGLVRLITPPATLTSTYKGGEVRFRYAGKDVVISTYFNEFSISHSVAVYTELGREVFRLCTPLPREEFLPDFFRAFGMKAADVKVVP